jgi:hypothetical protein
MKKKLAVAPKPAAGAPPQAGTCVFADERRAKGKALRDAASRILHAGCKPPEGRRNPIDIVLVSNEGRIPELIPIRYGRLSASPFAFYRGSAAPVAADLATTPVARASTANAWATTRRCGRSASGRRGQGHCAQPAGPITATAGSLSGRLRRANAQ